MQRGASRWMLYFMAMLGSASGQETLVDYWFLWGDEKAAIPGGDASRVIRVEGAKGEQYVPVYEDMHCHPLVAQARAGLNARMRQEALKLSRQYRDAGMSPEAAYEKAWAEVYQRFRSQSSKEEAKETLLQLVARTQAAGAGVSATDAAVQHVLQLLVLHEELLATAEARELLDYLSRQQFNFEKEALLAEPGTNDALMVLFADAMNHGMKGANAFRDAQFKLNRERIIHHELTGYRAPWGAGLGSRINYRQASRKKVIAATTLGSGTLKTALPDEEEKEKQQEQEEEKKVTTASGEAENNGPKPVYMGPLSSGGDAPRRFAMMRAAAPAAVADEPANLTVNGNAAVYIGSDGLTGNGATELGRSGWLYYSYSIKKKGSHNNATFGNLPNTGSTKYWYDKSQLSVSWKNNPCTLDNGISDELDIIEIGEGNNLFIGGDAYKGTLRVALSAAAGDYATVGGYDASQASVSLGALTGKGNLLLRGYETSGSNTFSFSSSDSDFGGTLYMTADGSGSVQLNLAGRWADTLVDFALPGTVSASAFGSNNNASAAKILNLTADTHLRGLQNGSSASSVQTNGHALTLGAAGGSYTYSGTLSGSPTLIKQGSNTQVFTQAVQVAELQVQDGTLQFDAAVTAPVITVEAGGTLATAAGVAVETLNLYGGASWNMGGNVNTADATIDLFDMQGGCIMLNAMSSTSNPVWTVASTFNFSNSGLNSYDAALFQVGEGVTFKLGQELAFYNISGSFGAGDKFTLYSGDAASLAGFDGQSVKLILNDSYYESSYVWDAASSSLLLQLNSDAMVIPTQYIWSGEDAGTDCNKQGLNLGSVWRADGSAENSGWHEQAAHGKAPGVYANGSSVLFADVDFHGNAEAHRNVTILGAVAPGLIEVTAGTASGSSQYNVTSSWTFLGDLVKLGIGSGGDTTASINVALQYGYALTGGNATASIVDVKDAQGNIITPTRIVNNGGSLLVLNTSNSYTGGTEVVSGGLYLGCANAAGLGAITLHGDKSWTRYENTTSSTTSRQMLGTELVINYNSSNLDYKTPSIDNSLILAAKDSNSQFHVSFGNAFYGETDSSRLPASSRYVSLQGGVYGSGNLYFQGFTYANDSTYNYVSSFAVNEKNVQQGLLPVDCPEAFSGTVYLRNEANTSTAAGRNWFYNALLGGAVQLVLEDGVFADAVLNMTREQTTKSVGWEPNWLGSLFGIESDNAEASQTSDNILVLNGNVSLKGLDAGFRGSAWRHSSGLLVARTNYEENLSQEKERWRVRVVTRSAVTLTLNDNSSASSQHVYSGAMGFAQSYVQPGQDYISEFNNSATDASFSAGGGSLGVEVLSLTKRGVAQQYIHSAKLRDLSLIQGILGFNNLSLSGNMNLVGGSTLKLGVTTGVKDEQGKTWSSIDGVTSNSVTVTRGNRLLVIAPNDGQSNPAPAVVEGSITMNSGASLAFYLLRTSPSIQADHPLLNVDGDLNLQSDTAISLNFASIEFAKTAGNNTYYLAAANAITVGGKDSSAFVSQMIPLGYGYYGILDTLDNQNSHDYLVMTVVGDPRRTWSGYLADTPDSPSIWKHEDGAASNDDLRWKEKHGFQNGHLVLFGNRYEPVGWNESDWTASAASTSKVSSTLGQGVLESVEVDGEIISGVDKVCVSGKVAPASLIFNADYFNASDKEQTDSTNYYLYAAADGGSIRDVDTTNPDEMALLPGLEDNTIDTADWKTSLRKLGLGTVIINMVNTFSGGSTIEGGRLVMQNSAALGDATGVISILNGAMLQGDYKDASRPVFAYGAPYEGEGMYTTTVLNPVVVSVFQDPDNPEYDELVDAYIANASDKKMVLTKLSGAADAVVLLYGTSYNPAVSDTNTYAVFKVLDPGEFYGTIKLDGNLLGTNAYQNLWDGDDENNPAGGKVQMEIMTTAKSGGDAMSAAGKTPPDWLHTTIDLSVENGTERTVLALDALGTDNAAGVQVAQVAALQGISTDGKRMNSSVLSMSHEKTITLEIEGSRNGNYDGVLGFGDFQKTVDYHGNKSEIGMVKHHYGRSGSGYGELNVLKLGSSYQSVNSAWLNVLELGNRNTAESGGRFIVDETLVLSSIKTVDGSHISVGADVDSSMYGLAVGKGGVLAIDNAGIVDADGNKIDAFAQLGAGRAKYSEIVPDDANNQENATKEIEHAPSAFVYLGNGATITGFGDWYTNMEREVTLKDGDAQKTETIAVDIRIDTLATVTFNTHNFTPDETISVENDVFGRYNQSHVIQLLGEMKGSDVNLIFNNELISEAAQDAGTAKERADGLGYEGETGTEMGHVAIRDIHQFTGNITVKDMTALQVNQTNTAANAEKADIEVTVTGKNGALQFVDGVTDQYINQVNLEQGGHVLFGGELQESRTGWKSLDQTQVEVDIAHREGKPAGSINNLDLVKHTSNKSISIGGTAATPAVAANVHITSRKTAEAYNALELLDTHLQGSIVELHEACRLDIADAVVVDRESVVRASVADGGIDTSAIAVNPEMLQANLNVPDVSELGNKVSTSVGTVVQMTFTGHSHQSYTVGSEEILVVQADQLQGVDVTGDGLTLQIHDDTWYTWVTPGTRYMAVQMGGGSGQFHYEVDNTTASASFGSLIGSQFVLQDKDGNTHEHLYWVTSTEVSEATGKTVSPYLLYFAVNIPEPATTTLSLLALAGLCARRRRR